MQKESRFYRKIKPFLESIPYSYWEKIQAGSLRGRSDIFGCVRGKFVALELKKDSKESTSKGRARLQSVLQDQIKAAGGIAYFVTPENWDAVFKELLQIQSGAR